jgi:hypothetical protein
MSPQSSNKGYKAVVYVLLSGGADTYNMLVPHTCSSTNQNGQTLREQYNTERTTVAFYMTMSAPDESSMPSGSHVNSLPHTKTWRLLRDCTRGATLLFLPMLEF